MLLFGGIDGGIDVEEKEGFYPFNNCFVETYELPGNYGNHKMEADKDLYFKGYYIPRSFSLLVKGGTTSSIATGIAIEMKLPLRQCHCNFSHTATGSTGFWKNRCRGLCLFRW